MYQVVSFQSPGSIMFILSKGQKNELFFLAELKLYYEALLASHSYTVRLFIGQNSKSVIYPLRGMV